MVPGMALVPVANQTLWMCVHTLVLVWGSDETGRTALHWAADRGHVSIVEVLVGGGAAVDLEVSDLSPLRGSRECFWGFFL